MKRGKRVAALVLAVCLLCTCLTGCDLLDEARAAHAKWGDDGQIVYNDTEYLLLPECDYLFPVFSDYETMLWVTAPDVPLLLQSMFGEAYWVSDDGVFLEDQRGETLYCRTDRYQEVTAMIRGGFTPVVWSYEYESYDEEEGIYTYAIYDLSDQEKGQVQAVIDTVSPTVIPTAALAYDFYVEITACTADHLFREYVVDVMTVDDAYYLVNYGEEECAMYKVPASLSLAIASIVAPAKEAYDAYWESDDHLDLDDGIVAGEEDGEQGA